MRKILISSFAFALILSSAIGLAQQVSTPGKSPAASEQMQKMQQQIKKMEEETKKRQQQELERLKQVNPGLYQVRKDSLDRQQKISAVVTFFRQGKISAAQAESQLKPLVKQDLQNSIQGLDQKIKRLESSLSKLKKAKQDPNLLVQERIDQLLGKTQPRPEDFIY